jgi:kynurenine formamidase
VKKLIDLTHTFTDDMPVYPGDPCSRLYQCAEIETDGSRDHKIESCMHVGTHIDAPFHMIDDGLIVSEIPVEQFQGRGVLVDARKTMVIDENILENIDLQEGDIVLVRTDWYKKWRTDEYFKEWPIFTVPFCEKLVEAKISVVGMDTGGPDMDASFPAHKALLPNNVLIVENLTNLEALEDIQNFRVHAYPVKYESDAAPVRVVAEVI